MPSTLNHPAATLHTPERLTGESFDAYRERRAESKAAARKTMGHHLNGGVASRQSLRDEMRKSGTMGKRTRAYVALLAAWASKRVTKGALRDENGAYTLVGATVERTGRGVRPAAGEHLVGGIVAGRDAAVESCFRVRRIWLGGISAQRGF